MNPLNHVAIIMDGNGRWGLENKNSRNSGHKQGIKVVSDIINFCLIEKINFLTLYAFSTENWKRPKKEINYLFSLLENFLVKNIDELINKNIRLKIIGKKIFSKKLNKLLTSSEKKTKKNYKLQVNLAINYGARQEIVDTINLMKKKKIFFSEKNISDNLYTKNVPDPDILIRTGDVCRLSNFLLWQLSYTEIFFIKKLWPDFSIIDLKKIITKYDKIKRNFGSI